MSKPELAELMMSELWTSVPRPTTLSTKPSVHPMYKPRDKETEIGIWQIACSQPSFFLRNSELIMPNMVSSESLSMINFVLGSAGHRCLKSLLQCQ